MNSKSNLKNTQFPHKICRLNVNKNAKQKCQSNQM